MKLSLNNILMICLITVAGLAGSSVVGLIMYGTEIFETSSVAFSFVAFGLSGGCIFAFYHVRGLQEAITVATIISAVQFAVATTWITVLRSAVFSFGVNMPVVALAFLFERKLSHLSWARFLVVGLVYGAMFVLLSLLVAEFLGIEEMPAAVFRENFRDGVMIGIGLGIGVQGGEAFALSFEQHRREKRS